MFRSLRNRLVLINVTITTIVLLIAFCTIYLVAQNSANKRPLPPKEPEFSASETRIIENHVRDERKKSLESLVISLVIVGVVVEIAVVLVSLTVADIAIQPVRESYEAQRDFIANASHEMKTPLAAIAANLEAADIQDNHWITNVESEVELLSRINQDLLLLSKAENARTQMRDLELISVQDFLKEGLKSFDGLITQKGIEVHYEVIPEGVKIKTATHDLQQILRILFDNAIKYGSKKANVRYVDGEFWVENDGKAIPPEKLARVFDRFYQVDKSSEGSGLGLAIAKALTERNGWKLRVTSNDITAFRLKIK